MRQQIESRIMQLNLKNSVLLTGVRADVHRMMQAMDVFILPSLWEGLALVSVEAQAAGLPCYFSDTVTRESAITDLVQYLPISDPEAWAKKILSDKQGRKNTTKTIIEAGYDIAKSAQWLEQFYVDLNEEIAQQRGKT